MTSLKKAEFGLDLQVEEMPHHHAMEGMTKQQVDEVRSYMKNDIWATYILFKLVLGDTEHPVYKQNNQLELRYQIMEQFEIKCLNYSDIKMGDELMKHSYAKEIGKSVRDLPKNGTFRKKIKLKECIPEYVVFQTPVLQSLLKELKAQEIKQTDKVEKKLVLWGRNYTLGKGGLHADQENEIWEAIEEHDDEEDSIGDFIVDAEDEPISKKRNKRKANYTNG